MANHEDLPSYQKVRLNERETGLSLKGERKTVNGGGKTVHLKGEGEGEGGKVTLLCMTLLNIRRSTFIKHIR